MSRAGAKTIRELLLEALLGGFADYTVTTQPRGDDIELVVEEYGPEPLLIETASVRFPTSWPAELVAAVNLDVHTVLVFSEEIDPA
jgi:hypothetical protein